MKQDMQICRYAALSEDDCSFLGNLKRVRVSGVGILGIGIGEPETGSLSLT